MKKSPQPISTENQLYQNETLNIDELLYQHDTKLLEIDQRLRSLENLVNAMHNKYPVWWSEQ